MAERKVAGVSILPDLWDCQLGGWASPSGGAFVLPGQLYPLIVLVCQTCGNTILLNAMVAGIVKAPPPQPPLADAPSPSTEPSQEVKQ